MPGPDGPWGVDPLLVAGPTTLAKLLVRTAEEIRQNQHKNAEARQSHIKRTLERLRELGIKLTEIPWLRSSFAMVLARSRSPV